MEVSQLADWFDILYKALTALFVIWMFFERKNDKTHVRITEIEKRIDIRLDSHSERLARVEGDLRNGINIDDIKVIHRRIDELIKASSKTEGQLEMLIKSVQSITDRK